MIAQLIGFLIRNLPAVLFVLALIIAWARRRGSAAERLLAWILLLPIGVTGLWAGIYHVFFPAIAAAHIGWQVSPFQFEVGMADLAIGVTACIAFRRDLKLQGSGRQCRLDLLARRCRRACQADGGRRQLCAG